ncbi:MAG: SDR family NAD(P)-dependent oxidoreductase [Rhodospirillales bacterium]|nr:SDR family NAD(P)-dependent oxidoreductase [Rhodospirillales bacterium]
MEIAGQTAIVTGAAQGLGAAVAALFAEEGAKVALVDRNAEALASQAKAIGGFAQCCDVADPTGAADAVAAIVRQLGPPRVLVNCAGIAPAKRVLGREGPMDLAAFDTVVRVNLIGTFNMLRLAAAAMSAAPPLDDDERGVIISTASVAAFEGQVGQAAYSASKGGVVAMTLPIARELAQFGIRVLAIAPGIFETPLLQTLPPEAQAALGASIPFPRRFAKPREFADLVLHMVRNRALNGEVVRLDGALRLPPR